ncbi:MAG: helix-turn-helix domain-containing protein [Oscillibacter sp.]|nr:helix-turn-helix domain-containing protein [Oscillibacter sp.]
MEGQRSYWGVIPGEVFHDKELPAAAKLLYLALSSMAHRDGYCWPSNETLAAEMDMSKRRVQELLGQLQARGYIRVDVRRLAETGKVERRYIYCGLFTGKDAPPASCGIPHGPPAEQFTPPREISQGPHEISRTSIIGRKDKLENIPPLPPTGGKRTGGRRDKSVPAWNPERFEAFWEFYRTHARGEDRQGAAKSWDRLRPDGALMDVMARALRAQVRSEQWRAGVGIPYAKTWLNNQRWKDTPKPPRDPGPPEEEGVTYI